MSQHLFPLSYQQQQRECIGVCRRDVTQVVNGAAHPRRHAAGPVQGAPATAPLPRTHARRMIPYDASNSMFPPLHGLSPSPIRPYAHDISASMPLPRHPHSILPPLNLLSPSPILRYAHDSLAPISSLPFHLRPCFHPDASTSASPPDTPARRLPSPF